LSAPKAVRQVSVEEAKALLDDGVQFVDVLPHETYLQEHLPGAVSLPLADIDTAPERLDPDRPVVVYCYDHQ
jgi:rhodanese-related sulfurtransferase